MNRFILLLGMLGTMFPVLAQNKITGKVVDEKGEAFPRRHHGFRPAYDGGGQQ